MQVTENLRVVEMIPLVAPRVLKAGLPMTEETGAIVTTGREAIRRILSQDDPRLLIVVGPCSIHDVKGALEYAGKLNALRVELKGRLEIIMRVYFEKPRTTIGWKGLINDPRLDNSYDIETGLKQARQLLLQLAGMGLPAATEFLDPIVPAYIADLVTWAAIGARTTESQTHREMASGLSMPVGFKNGTDGSCQSAIEAMLAARRPHSFIGMDDDGATAHRAHGGQRQSGTSCCAAGGPRAITTPRASATPRASWPRPGLPGGVMVDCSHANSGKQHARQEEAWRSVLRQRADGDRASSA